MRTLKVLTAFLAIALLISSCAKDGATGATGPAGPTGAAGTNGTNGVANVSTVFFTITTGQWVSHGNWFSVNELVPALTDSMNDVVISCVSKTTGLYSGQWYALPVPALFATGDDMNFVYGKGQETIAYNSPTSSAPTQTVMIKTAVIPPAVIKQHPNVNWSNKAEVAALPEVERALNQ